MYKNLEMCIFEQRLSKKEIAKTLGIGYNTLLDKLAGKYPMKLDEAFRIRNEFFPDKTFDWLFEKNVA